MKALDFITVSASVPKVFILGISLAAVCISNLSSLEASQSTRPRVFVQLNIQMKL